MTVLIAGHSGVNRLVRGETVKQALSAANSTVAKGVYDATLLETVDADLAAANIITGKNIFGKAGSASPGTATHDIEANAVSAGVTDASSGSPTYHYLESIASGADYDLATLTQTYTAGSLTEAYGFGLMVAATLNELKLRLYANGVQIGESAYIGTSFFNFVTVNGNKALSGSMVVKISVHNYAGGVSNLYVCGKTLNGASTFVAGVFAGSVKVV